MAHLRRRGVPDTDIRKLNHTGTHPVHTDLAIENAIDFHEAIGIERKEARLRYLQQYWTKQVRGVRNIMVNTPSDPKRSCAIANVGIATMKPGDLAKTLLDRYKVWTVAINTANVQGVRVTPQLFTTPAELDVLVRASRSWRRRDANRRALRHSRNLPALDAVLDAVHREQVDLIVVGGDVVPGPMPRETITRLLELDTPIGSSWETATASSTRQWPRGNRRSSSPVPRDHRVERQPTRRDSRNVVRQLAADAASPGAEMGDVLFCHATPGSDTEIFTRLTPDTRVSSLLQNVEADLVICGHTHMQFDRTVGDVRVVNAGSVGMPFGPPGAYWLLLGPGVELRHTPYDLERAAEQVRATAYPQAEDFAARNVLHPPSEADMLGAFSKA